MDGKRKTVLFTAAFFVLALALLVGTFAMQLSLRRTLDAAPAAAQPIFQKVPPRPYTMAMYLGEVAELFRGHEILRDYAAWLGARIVNRTRGSLIDAYERDPLD